MMLKKFITSTTTTIGMQLYVVMQTFKSQIKRYPDVIGKKRLHSRNQRSKIILEINILARK